MKKVQILLMVSLLLAMVCVAQAIPLPSGEEVDSVEDALPKEVPSAPPGLAEEKLLYSLAERVAVLERNLTLLQEENAALKEDKDLLMKVAILLAPYLEEQYPEAAAAVQPELRFAGPPVHYIEELVGKTGVDLFCPSFYFML